MTIHRLTFVALLAAMSGLTACGGGSHANKAGATSTKPTTLRLSIPDVGDTYGRFFAKAVEQHSDGRVKITVDDSYDSSDTRKEARLAAALSDGSAQLGYIPARDWAAPGMPEFQALAAPFSVTTQDAMQAVAKSDFADDALASLERKHVVGLGLIPVEPRQLLSRRPLITPADFRSASVRVVLNEAVADAVSAMGGTVVDEPLSPKVRTLLDKGKLTAAETSPQYALSNGYVSAAPYLTAFGLYGKFQVIGVSQRAWDGLDDTQQQALRDAAADTLERAQDLPARQAKELTAVCQQRAVVTQTSPGQLRQMVAAAKVDTSDYADAAKALAAIPGTGPQPSAVDVPPKCAQASDAAAASAALKQLEVQRPGGLPDSETAAIPDGTYEVTDTVKDWHEGGQFGADWNKPITWTTRMANGKMRETQEPDYPDQGPCAGTYRVKGDEVTFHWTKGVCAEIGDETVRWSYYNGRLAFRLVDVSDTASKVIYTAHPWRKVD